METEFKSLQAEQELLGAILIDNEIIPDIAEKLSPEDLYGDKHKLIYSKILSLYKASQQVTAISLYETLQGTEIQLSDLLELRNTTPSVSAYKTYLNIVTDYKKKRDIYQVCTNALAELYAHSSAKVSGELTEKLYDISAERTQHTIVDSSVLMEKTLNFIDMAFRTKGEGVGLRTGWTVFDSATNGFAKGDLIIIGARPSMGKTAFALELMQQFARKGHTSLLFEQEMSEEKLGLRLLSANSLTRTQKMYKGTIDETEMDHIIAESDIIAKMKKIYIDPTQSISLLQVRNKVRQLKQQADLEIIFIDHIALMSPSDSRKDANAQITEISKGLKAIAKEYNIVVVALSQLNRSVEKRNDKRPNLSDLRESGSLEQDADIVMLLYRDNYYNQDELPIHSNKPELLEVNIAKARDGKVGTLKFEFDMGTQKITEFITTEERVSRVGGKR